jgi:four helix bundle protein
MGKWGIGELGNLVTDNWKLEESGLQAVRLVRGGQSVSEQAERLKSRTMRFALDVCKLIQGLPAFEPGQTVKRQLAKSATSVAFNYRASCRARSHTEFVARIGIVAEEADETQGWLEFIDAAKLLDSPDVERLCHESRELVAIFSASYGTARSKRPT